MASTTTKARKTRVSRQPFWVPTDNHGKGAWRFLPTDEAHNQVVVRYDPVTEQRIGQQSTYEAKGWTPVFAMPVDDPRRKLLPENWQAYSRGDTRTAQFSDEQKALFDKQRPANAAA